MPRPGGHISRSLCSLSPMHMHIERHSLHEKSAPEARISAMATVRQVGHTSGAVYAQMSKWRMTQTIARYKRRLRRCAGRVPWTGTGATRKLLLIDGRKKVRRADQQQLPSLKHPCLIVHHADMGSGAGEGNTRAATICIAVHVVGEIVRDQVNLYNSCMRARGHTLDRESEVPRSICAGRKGA